MTLSFNFKVRKISGRLEIRLGLWKKRKFCFPGISLRESLLCATDGLYLIICLLLRATFSNFCAQKINLYHLETWCCQDFKSISEDHLHTAKWVREPKSNLREVTPLKSVFNWHVNHILCPVLLIAAKPGFISWVL